MGMLPDEIKPCMQGLFPSLIATCSLDGTPNATIISQVYYVDADHVALSYQFFNKTVRNVRENPHLYAQVYDIMAGLQPWHLELVYERSETSGPVFDAMDMQLEAIASATGMAGLFKLLAADIYRVTSVGKIEGALRPPVS